MYKNKQIQFHSPDDLSFLSGILHNIQVSDAAFRILIILMIAARDDGRVILSNSDIGRRVPRKSGKAMSRANVSRYVAELECGKLVEKRDGFIWLAREVLLNQQQSVVERTTLDMTTVVESTTPVVNPTTESREFANSDFSQMQTNDNSINTTISLKDGIELKEKKDLTKNLSKAQRDGLDVFTRERWPDAPCSMSHAEAYFERFFKDFGVEGVSPHDAAIEFFEYWDGKRKWMKVPRGKKTPIRISTWSALRYHATTWAKNIRDEVKSGKRKAPVHPGSGKYQQAGKWMTAEECNAHAKKYRITARHPDFYEMKREASGKVMWRFRGFADKVVKQAISITQTSRGYMR